MKDRRNVTEKQYRNSVENTTHTYSILGDDVISEPFRMFVLFLAHFLIQPTNTMENFNNGKNQQRKEE